MKNKFTLLLTLIIGLLPIAAFAHGEEDHGNDYHIEIAHIMENGFHGKLDGKIVEVVFASDIEIEKGGKQITLNSLNVSDSVIVQGVEMADNKIGASKITVDSTTDKAKKHGSMNEHLGHDKH